MKDILWIKHLLWMPRFCFLSKMYEDVSFNKFIHRLIGLNGLINVTALNSKNFSWISEKWRMEFLLSSNRPGFQKLRFRYYRICIQKLKMQLNWFRTICFQNVVAHNNLNGTGKRVQRINWFWLQETHFDFKE